jgi:2-polyprenyl-3-methyl-5-hydroxy-6-metoxy-1,4-benzoquinol methylase
MTLHRTTIDFQYSGPEASHTHAYLWQPVLRVLSECDCKNVFDLGCGNGAFARFLKKHRYEVSGVDPSEQGILQAKRADPELNVEVGSAYDPLWERFGKFAAIVSLEVVGHVCFPRDFAQCVRNLLDPKGIAIISTPYHGYFKNLLLATTGRLERHFSPIDDQGAIKYWSIATLTKLFAEAGFVRERVIRVGRIPIVAKSMILVFRLR